MAGLDFQFNVAKGAIRSYFETVDAGGDAALVVVPLEAASLQADSGLIDHETLADILAGSSNEQTTMGRQEITDVTVNIDHGNDRVELSFNGSITWTAADGAAVGKLIFCFDPNTGEGDDDDLIPLLAYSFDATPDGLDIVVSPHANGLIRIS